MEGGVRATAAQGGAVTEEAGLEGGGMAAAGREGVVRAAAETGEVV